MTLEQRLPRLAHAAVLSLCATFVFGACSGGDDEPSRGPQGPPGEILEFDAAAVENKQVCSGNPLPCVLRPSEQCKLGCATITECAGTPSLCEAQVTPFNCSAQSGCQWNLSGYCKGTAYSCDSFYDQFSCGAQQGCVWAPECVGAPTPCALLSGIECVNQPGCVQSS